MDDDIVRPPMYSLHAQPMEIRNTFPLWQTGFRPRTAMPVPDIYRSCGDSMDFPSCGVT